MKVRAALTPTIALVLLAGCAAQPQPARVVVIERPTPTPSENRNGTDAASLGAPETMAMTLPEAAAERGESPAPVNIRPLVGERGSTEVGTQNVSRVSFAEEGGDFDPCVSRDGRTLVFSSTRHRATSDIYMQRVGSRVVTQLTNDVGQDVMPKLSPDGSMIAFASDRSGNWDIFVMPVEGGKAVQVTADPSHEVSPSWSPDGSRLVFSRLGEASGRWEMWVTSLAKPGVSRYIGPGLFPQWCPVAGTGGEGADRILYQLGRERGRRAFGLWTLDLSDAGEAGNATQIASSAGQALINPSWSPDGGWVVFVRVPLDAARPDGPATPHTPNVRSSSVWMASVEGEGELRLTTGHGAALSPIWSRDNRLFFVSNLGGRENIWSADLTRAIATASAMIDAGERRAVTHEPTDHDAGRHGEAVASEEGASEE